MSEKRESVIMSDAMGQKEDGTWVNLIPLPNNYGELIPESVRNDSKALLELEKFTGGWKPYCLSCGDVARNVGVSFCDKCAQKDDKAKEERLNEWWKRWKLNGSKLDGLTPYPCEPLGPIEKYYVETNAKRWKT